MLTKRAQGQLQKQQRNVREGNIMINQKRKNIGIGAKDKSHAETYNNNNYYYCISGLYMILGTPNRVAPG
jgi:hypothetical protein